MANQPNKEHTPVIHRRIATWALFSVLSLAVAACSDTTAATTAHGPSQTVVTITDSPAWGPILTLASGETLYRLTADSVNKSTCYAECAVVWPPALLVPGQRSPAGRGVSGLGSFRRSGGRKQVTLNGIPLYRFEGDHAPGQVNGNIRDEWGQWWVVDPADPTATPMEKSSSTGSAAGAPSATRTAKPSGNGSPTDSGATKVPGGTPSGVGGSGGAAARKVTPDTTTTSPDTTTTTTPGGGGGVSY